MLMTKELEEILYEHPLGKHDGERVENIKVLCKFFMPGSRYTYYVTEGSKINETNWEFFGYVKSPITPDFDALEYGVLSDFENIKIPVDFMGQVVIMGMDMEIVNDLTLGMVMDTEEIL